MTARSLLLPAAGLAALIALPAEAAIGTDGSSPFARQQAHRPTGIQLAQTRDVDVFYDERGRRILLDPHTGEVIAIERPGREMERERLYDSGVLTARPARRDDAMDRYRRYREYQLGLREAPGADDLDSDAYEPYPPYEAYPEEPIERRPLTRDFALGEPPMGEPSLGDDPLDNPVTGSTPLDGGPLLPVEPGPSMATEDVARLQVLLDRAGVSPGVIDGRMGSNVEKALAALAEMTGEKLEIKDRTLIDSMLADTGGDAFTTYRISAADAAGPYVASVPSDYGHKARLERLSFTSVAEMLAERFHMDEAYLGALNPGIDFERPGTEIRVVAPGKPKAGEVARIVADKGRKQVRAYDAGGNLVAAYPATIGSSDTPSPGGTHTVERIAFDPEYTYNPKLNFKQGSNDKVLTIPPGPNGPVGSIWIALSKPTYGIHGTPDPSKIGKTSSHGCVRLTNWDAAELARMVKPGIFVQFIE